MKTMMGNSNFQRKIVVFYSAAKITGPLLQELIEDGLLQARHPSAGGDGSLNRLSQLLHACQQVKTVPTRTVQRYIQEYVDAKWCKLKDGKMGFKFNGKAAATMPEVTWFEWSGNTENKAKVDVDLLTMLQIMKKKAAQAVEKGGTVEHGELLPEIDKLINLAKAQVHKPEPVPFVATAPVEDEVTV